MKARSTAGSIEHPEKPRDTGYPDPLRRWSGWDKGSDQCRASQTEYQGCIVHQVRNTLKHVADLKRIYAAPDSIRANLNSTYRRLNRQRSVFPSGQALYLATFGAVKKWTVPVRDWGKAYGELSMMYKGRQGRYDEWHTAQIQLKLHQKTDADILKWIRKQENSRTSSIQGAIKTLIREETARQQIAGPPNT